jgi:hypothetical protein
MDQLNAIFIVPQTNFNPQVALVLPQITGISYGGGTNTCEVHMADGENWTIERQQGERLQQALNGWYTQQTPYATPAGAGTRN